MNRTALTLFISVAAAVALPTYSLPSDVEYVDSVHVLGELNVVALKQKEMLRDDAAASTVLSQHELEQINASAMRNISDVVPNFYIPEYGSRATSTIYVRGIGARMDQPSVGLNVDNVPFLNKNNYDFDLADIASVEMLRGPQSTLYGRNTIGGLINITTLSPMRFQGWRLMAQGGSGDDWKASAGWYHKFNPRLASAVVASFSHLGGFFRNQYNGRHVDVETSGMLRWKLESVVKDNFRIRNAASASVLRQGGYPYEYVVSGEINYNDTCFYRRFVFNDGLTMNWRLENVTVSSVTSVQYLDDNMTLDQDFLPLSYFTLTQRQKEVAVTEDVVTRGEGLDSRWQWVSGIFGFYKRISMSAPVTFKDDGIASLIESHRNDANPDYPIAWRGREFDLSSDFKIPTYGIALYHESSFMLGNWKLSAGMRFDWESSGLDYHSYCNTAYEVLRKTSDGSFEHYLDVPVDIDDRGRLSKGYFQWLPKITALYELPMEGENNVYLSVAKGYKSGGYNTQMFSEVLQQRLMGIMGIGKQYDINDVVGYKPEWSWNYEIGSHLTFPGCNLSADFSAFYIDCRDQQLTMFPAGTTTGRIMTNAGRTRNCGVELSIHWNPFSTLQFDASYGYTNARFRKFNNGIADYRGMYIPYAPQNTIFGQLQYTFDFSDSFIRCCTVAADARATGRIYWNEDNSIYQNLYILPGASVTLSGSKWNLTIFGKNLSNTDYFTFYFKSMGNEFLQRGRPIQLGATLRYEF